MKRSTFIGILLLNFTFGFGQSIVTSDKQWDNLIHYYVFPNDVYGTEHIKFTTDTLINSVTFKKVERSLDENQVNWLPYGYIRENGIRQVYFKIYPSDTERLLYDLHLQVNDTVHVYGLITSVNSYIGLDPMTFYVDYVDSVLIGQTYRRRLNLSIPGKSNSIWEQWVDSTGGMREGMLHNCYEYVGRDAYRLLCFFEDGQLQYHDSIYTTCYVSTSVDRKESTTSTVTVAPNPVTGVSLFTISSTIDNEHSISVSFHDILGKEVFSSLGKKQFFINKKDFSLGVYLYFVTFDNKNTGIGKIIFN